MFQDEIYIHETKTLIGRERAKMYQKLQESPDFKPFLPSANFILTKILHENITSEDLFERAIRRGMMIRDCSTFPFLDQKYIRFCIMNPEDNERLLSCLMEN